MNGPDESSVTAGLWH